jgi:selenocysteine lyase/cysteine desulfurase
MHNIERVRNDFPALHKMLFFASAGVGPLPRSAMVVMQHYSKERRVDFAEGVWEEDPKKEARGRAAKLINASAEEIIPTMSTSAGINLLAGGLKWRRGENIVLNDLEYPSNVFPWLYQADRHGLEVRIVRSHNGVVPRDEMIDAIDRKTRVLAVSHVEFGTGYRNDVAALAEAVHAAGGLICVDAIQSVGVLHVDVKELGIDLLATGGYKWLCGPIGTGFAYLREDLLDTVQPPTAGYLNLPPEEHETVWNALVSGSDYPMEHTPLASDGSRFEAQGLSPLLFKGFVASLQYFLDLGTEVIEARVSELVDHFIHTLQREEITILSPTGLKARSGIVTVRVPFDLSNPEEVKKLEKKLHHAKILALPRSGGLRFAIHFFNTKEELDQVVDFIKRL